MGPFSRWRSLLGIALPRGPAGSARLGATARLTVCKVRPDDRHRRELPYRSSDSRHCWYGTGGFCQRHGRCAILSQGAEYYHLLEGQPVDRDLRDLRLPFVCSSDSRMGLEANPNIILGMHAMGSDRAGQIGSVAAVRAVLALLARWETTFLRGRIDSWTSTRS